MKKLLLSTLIMVGLAHTTARPTGLAKQEKLGNILKTAGLASATLGLGLATAYLAYKTKTNLQIKGLPGSGQPDLFSPTIAACAGIPTTALCAILTGAFGFSLYNKLHIHNCLTPVKNFFTGISACLKRKVTR